jgi:hypothetical protein
VRWKAFVEDWHGAKEREGLRESVCCQFAAEEDAESEEGVYDCTTCPVADALHELYDDPVNAQAWRLYHRCVNRLTVEGHAIGSVFDRLTVGMEREEYLDYLDRVSFAFDVLNPLPEPK